jgi:glycosyltransferase involved in cell wall biosynthesis
MPNKKVIIISAINFFEGGPLSILKDCLSFLNGSVYLNDFKFIALVHKKDLFTQDEYSNIEFIEFPKSRKSYFFRLYYEYIYFKKFAKEKGVFFWLSLHDISPNIGLIPQAVYCHNPSPFNTINPKDIYIQPIQFFFRLFYKYLYKINIKKNKYVIVQQLWIKNRFVEMFHLDSNKIIVAPPQTPTIPMEYLEKKRIISGKEKIFFFPTFPRPFKNIQIICEAVQLILDAKHQNFKVIITIDGSENNYSKWIVDNYKNVANIDFIGLIKREEVYHYYSISDCLLFPSKLETWGLPISEFKQFEKPMLVADLLYAKETVGGYKLARFFNVNSPVELSELMIAFLENKLTYDSTRFVNYEQPFVQGWQQLFNTLLEENKNKFIC